MRDLAHQPRNALHLDPQAPPRSSARWYLNRLRCMEPGEMPFRILRILTTRAESLGLRRDTPPPPDLTCTADPWVDLQPDVETERYLQAADRIVAGQLDVFALRGIDLGSPPRWNRDPKTGTDAPLRFGKLLDYRDPHLVGDIKYLWEPNRHMHLVTLAQAYALSHDPRYFDELRIQLQSWFAACPFRMGINWSNALEPALRLINWSLAWQLLGGMRSEAFSTAAGQQLRGQWLRSVYQHAAFVRGYFSLHSSANNHLIGEAAGVFVAACTWPHWPRMQHWLKDAQAVLEREALLQNAADGVNREQAVTYQQFEFDLLLLAWLAGRANGIEFSAAFVARLEVMLEYFASIMDAGGHIPMFGDSDDGYAVRLSQQPGFCPFRSLLATGAILFRRGDFKAKAGDLDDKTRWLLGAMSEQYFKSVTAAPDLLPVRRAFPEGGYYILGCDFETSAEVRMVADAGPLGYRGIAAHGHADALAFTLSLGGREIFIDPGTYTYRADSRWRAYFRGTAAHNTVRIDGLDQSEPGGNFMWLSKADAACAIWHTTPAQDSFEGWHEGYARLTDPVIHRRRIVLNKRSKSIRRFLIEDYLQMSGTHSVELFFHCSEQCQLSAQGGVYCLVRDDVNVQIRLPENMGSQVRICCGQHEPPLGWISRQFDVKRPSPTLVWQARLTGNTMLRTTIIC